MPKGSSRLPWATGVLWIAVGCTVQTPYRQYIAPSQPPVSDTLAAAQLVRLATLISEGRTDIRSAPPGTCGATASPVVHLVLPEQVLFATASDQPGPNAATTLEDIVGKVIQQAPDAELTVLGHTDAVGSDAYNMDLSKRRAVTVLHALAIRGLDPKRLSAIAIGKRQPIADDSTPDGRARNRRVEFLVSRCLKANMSVVTGRPTNRTLSDPYEEANPSVEVLRLDPAGAFGLSPVAALALHPRQVDQPKPATMHASTPARPSHMLPSTGVARPAPAPHYQPRTLSPDVEHNPLGPAVPF